MTDMPVTLDELLEAREALIREIIGNMPDDHRRFLISFERGEPDWPLLGLEHASDLPAVRWRQLNLDKLSQEARGNLVRELERKLGDDE